jgi:hypothetical protein
MDSFLQPFLMTSAVPGLLVVICLVTAGLAFVSDSLGSAAGVAGCGFGALAAAWALRVAANYTQFSGMAAHTPTMEIARVITLETLGSGLLQIAGVVLVAIAMFQRRPAGQASGAM